MFMLYFGFPPPREMITQLPKLSPGCIAYRGVRKIRYELERFSRQLRDEVRQTSLSLVTSLGEESASVGRYELSVRTE
jgi:hypothetical protein